MKKKCRLYVACPNPSCKFFGKKSTKKIINKIVKRGRKLNGTLNYTCTHCGRSFAETSGTIFYHSKINHQQAKQIINLLMMEGSIRGISRITGLNKNTILKFVNKMIKERKMTNTFMLKELKFTKKEINCFWAQIDKLKKQKQRYQRET